MAYSNHLKLGKRKVKFKDRDVVTSVTSDKFTRDLNAILKLPKRVGVIPPGYEHRADLIADLFYGSAKMDWLVLWVNKISDPFQQLNIGDRIVIVDLI